MFKIRPPPAAPNPQNLVANGLAFTEDGDLYIADTARGAIWKVEFDRRGKLKSRTGCDTTFTPNTLCLENVFVAHPSLEGTDGIALDRAGNIWNSANERNAIVVVTKHQRVVEVFRNPVNAALLRNSADPAVGDNHILELPTSPFLLGKLFCTANSDGDRRDNSPRAAGEINGGAGAERGKISCMDQALEIPGLPLPVR
jgi:sugar lactone lactonase YvrE